MSWRFVIKWCLSLLFSVMKHGVHLYSILDAQTRINKNKTALIIDGVEVSFEDLKHRTDQLICEWIKPEYQSQFPNQLALMLEQDLDSLAALFALSRLGKDIVIINPNLIEHKLQTLLDHKNFYLIGHLARLKKIKVQHYSDIPPQHDSQHFHIKRYFFNKISVCSSGSTGIPKVATRHSNPLQCLPLLDLMLRQLKFFKIKQIFVMTPICHAAGLTASLMALSFHKTVILQNRFDVQSACLWIKHYQIDCLNLVPTILHRLIKSRSMLSSVQHIISGSSPLSAHLVHQVQQHYPYIQLFNLYGSSETGINMIATPKDLKTHPDSIGRAIQGVELKITDLSGEILEHGQIGTLWSKCAWSITPNQWIECGDLAVRDSQGYYYLKGRRDDMLICGGINVYPIDLENILYQHSLIEYAQAYAVDDVDLGQCLAVKIILKQYLDLNQLQDWISQKAPRYLRPKSIFIIDQIESDSIGKPI
ncbi:MULTISPECIES: class I adenylate-forming enzyme family protein [Acinetobacter]|uniref:class I adenylate-forming enzyme family protein n=1 Tax=Acinetobacter TaxID=469 RepID=UPI00054D2FC4|nr:MULTISPECIES: class I adenylate-forming enzyme family protein [Acinetobacter]MBJ8424537.1 acyl--CoA ligase [Acinetobacter bereziniae]MBJ8473731.1 acyl--CoA ligase [Acinetobacter bereziniae]